jgi:hypothetical protein
MMRSNMQRHLPKTNRLFLHHLDLDLLVLLNYLMTPYVA